jgi:DNA polymerase-3 subunit delta'
MPFQDEPAARELLQDVSGGQVAHAYLLTGPATGHQGQAAELFTQALLCQQPNEGRPCGDCPSCQAWLNNAHPDFHRLGADGNSIKIEQIRSWSPFFLYRPNMGRHQVFYLAAPELLTAEAANSLLKNLEEPITGTVFLLVTADESAVMPTIVSRCRVVLFRKESSQPAAEIEESADNTGTARVKELLWNGREAELLAYLRKSKYDRQAARYLLKYLLADMERIHQVERRRLIDGQGNLHLSAALLQIMEIIVRGMSLLDDNVQVSLLLTVTLYQVQKRLRRIPARPSMSGAN